MENFSTPEYIEKRKAELIQDIQYVDRNLLGISSMIVKEINTLNALKGGINLYKLEGIEIDRKNNKASISNLETFERQLTRTVEETTEKISIKSNFIKKLTDEHTRISAIKANLEAEFRKLSAFPKVKTSTTQKKSTGQQLTFDLNSKK